jgi:hypothetical protein
MCIHIDVFTYILVYVCIDTFISLYGLIHIPALSTTGDSSANDSHDDIPLQDCKYISIYI